MSPGPARGHPQGLRVVAGTDLDFASYVAARRPALLRWARAVTGDPHTAEDVLQTSLVRVLARWDDLRDKARRRRLRPAHGRAAARQLAPPAVAPRRGQRGRGARPAGRPDGDGPAGCSAVADAEQATRPLGAGRGAARAAARGGGAALLRAAQRRRDGRRPRLLDRHGEVQHQPRPGDAAPPRPPARRWPDERRATARRPSRQRWLPGRLRAPAPVEVAFGHHLRPIGPDDADLDVVAVTGSRERLWRTYGAASGWPPADLIDRGRPRPTSPDAPPRRSAARRSATRCSTPTRRPCWATSYIGPPEQAGADAEVSWWVVDECVGTELGPRARRARAALDRRGLAPRRARASRFLDFPARSQRIHRVATHRRRHERHTHARAAAPVPVPAAPVVEQRADDAAARAAPPAHGPGRGGRRDLPPRRRGRGARWRRDLGRHPRRADHLRRRHGHHHLDGVEAGAGARRGRLGGVGRAEGAAQRGQDRREGPAGRGVGLRHHPHLGRHHPHQQPRRRARRGRRVADGRLRRRHQRERRDPRHRPADRHRRHQGRRGLRPHPRHHRQVGQPRGRRGRRRDRVALRPRRHGHQRHRQRARTGRSTSAPTTRATAPPTPRSRPTPPSTPATPAARWST